MSRTEQRSGSKKKLVAKSLGLQKDRQWGQRGHGGQWQTQLRKTQYRRGENWRRGAHPAQSAGHGGGQRQIRQAPSVAPGMDSGPRPDSPSLVSPPPPPLYPVIRPRFALHAQLCALQRYPTWRLSSQTPPPVAQRPRPLTNESSEEPRGRGQ